MHLRNILPFKCPSKDMVMFPLHALRQFCQMYWHNMCVDHFFENIAYLRHYNNESYVWSIKTVNAPKTFHHLPQFQEPRCELHFMAISSNAWRNWMWLRWNLYYRIILPMICQLMLDCWVFYGGLYDNFISSTLSLESRFHHFRDWLLTISTDNFICASCVREFSSGGSTCSLGEGES